MLGIIVMALIFLPVVLQRLHIIRLVCVIFIWTIGRELLYLSNYRWVERHSALACYMMFSVTATCVCVCVCVVSISLGSVLIDAKKDADERV